MSREGGHDRRRAASQEKKSHHRRKECIDCKRGHALFVDDGKRERERETRAYLTNNPSYLYLQMPPYLPSSGYNDGCTLST